MSIHAFTHRTSPKRPRADRPAVREASTMKVQDPRSGSVVSALEAAQLIDPERRDEALAVVDGALAQKVEAPEGMRQRLAELGGYVGGAFVVAAAALFVFQQWDSMSVGQQVGLLAGVAVLLAGAGVVLGLTGGGMAALRAGVQPVRRRLASVLFTAASLAAAAAVIVWRIDVLQQRGTETTQGWSIGLAGSATLLVLAAVGYALAPSLLGQAAVAFGAAFAIPFALEGLGVVDNGLVPGICYLALGLGWLALAELGVWREILPGRVIGSVLVVVGAQVPLASEPQWVAYLLTALVAGAGFTMYVVRRAWPYVAVGVVGVTLAVPEALLDWTKGSLGTAGVLLVAGVALLGASLVGLRLHKEVEESS